MGQMRFFFGKKQTPGARLAAAIGSSEKNLSDSLSDLDVIADIDERLGQLAKNVAALNTASQRIEKRQYRLETTLIARDNQMMPVMPPKDNGKHSMPERADTLDYDIEPNMP